MRDLVTNLHNQAVRFSHDGLKFHARNEFDRVAVSLYATIIEHTGSIMSLTDKRLDGGVYTILRFTLDAHIDLVNLLKDEAYLNRMKLAENDYWLQFMDFAKCWDNDLLSDVAESKNLHAEISQRQTEKVELETSGYRPLTFFERLAKSDSIEIYRAIFHMRDTDVHRNMSELTHRHLEMQNHKLEVVLYKDLQLQDFETALDVTAGILLDASQKMDQRFGTGDYFGKIAVDLEHRRKQLANQ